MKDLISDKYKHLLWKDEVGDSFLLLKYGEIFQYSQDVLRIHSWSKKIFMKTFSNLERICPIFNEWQTDDGLCIADINRADLPQVIEAWAPKKRFAKNSKWLKDKEKKLGHKIIQFKPELKGE